MHRSCLASRMTPFTVHKQPVYDTASGHMKSLDTLTCTCNENRHRAQILDLLCPWTSRCPGAHSCGSHLKKVYFRYHWCGMVS